MGNVLLKKVDASMLKDFQQQRQQTDERPVSANRELALISAHPET